MKIIFYYCWYCNASEMIDYHTVKQTQLLLCLVPSMLRPKDPMNLFTNFSNLLKGIIPLETHEYIELKSTLPSTYNVA